MKTECHATISNTGTTGVTKRPSKDLSFKFNPIFWNYAKFISSVLRHSMPIQKIVELITSLQFDVESINTWKNGVARALKKFIPNGTYLR